MELITDQLITRAIQVKAKDVFKIKNFDGLILHKLKQYEGKCMKYGYIIKDSTEIIQRSVGKICNIDKESLIEYNINYKIKSLLPKVGDKCECIIGSISKMGLISYIKYEGLDNINDTPLLVIIPKEFCELDKLKIDEKILIEVVDVRIKFMSNQIQLVGKSV